MSAPPPIERVHVCDGCARVARSRMALCIAACICSVLCVHATVFPSPSARLGHSGRRSGVGSEELALLLPFCPVALHATVTWSEPCHLRSATVRVLACIFPVRPEHDCPCLVFALSPCSVRNAELLNHSVRNVHAHGTVHAVCGCPGPPAPCARCACKRCCTAVHRVCVPRRPTLLPSTCGDGLLDNAPVCGCNMQCRCVTPARSSANFGASAGTGGVGV